MIENMFHQIWFFPLCALGLCALAMRFGRVIARRTNLLDRPGGRKQHDGAIPLVGGLILVPSFMICCGVYFLAVLGTIPTPMLALFAAMGLLLVVGAVDDARGMSPWVKFGAQFLAAFITVYWGQAQLFQLGNLFNLGDVGLDFMSLPFSIIAVVLLVNAVNLMDGLDGLAGGCVFVMLGALAIAFSGSAMVLPLFVLLAALCGFLFYNLRTPLHKRASVFLGDAGSLSLGLALAFFAIHAGKFTVIHFQPISVAWILALPIYDTCAQFNRRVREGRHPFSPDRGHFHHHFIDAGYGGGQATARIMVVTALFCAFGLYAPLAGIPYVLMSVLWIFGLFLHMWLSLKPDRYISIISKMRNYGI